MMDALPRTIDVILRGITDGLHIGAQLYVSHRGHVLADLVLAEAEPGRLLRHDTLVPWLSAGKPLTAVGIAWLWERNLLKLDDAIAKYIPAFDGGGREAITIRHCLTHTAGVRAAISAWTRQSFAEAVATVAAGPLEPGWVPGRTAGYHVASTWFLLGEVIREVSTRPVDTFLEEMICRPIGMDRARLSLTPDEWATLAASGGIGAGGNAVMHDTSGVSHRVPSWESADIFATPRPASGWRGPIRELGLFYEAMLPTAAKSPIRPETREALTARHRVGLVDATFKLKVDWGLGFICESSHYGQVNVPYQFGPHASPRAFGHGGNQSSVGLADPEHGLVAAVWFNGMPGDPRHDRRLRDTLAAIYEDLGLTTADAAAR